MEITWTNFLAEYDSEHPGPESVFRYTIRNTSPPHATNDLSYITLPTGINAGLFYVWPDQFAFEWQAWYGGETTYLLNTNHPVLPGSSITWEVRADSVVSRPGYVTGESATAVFAPVLVQAPAGPYPPPTLANLIIGSNAVSVTAGDLLWNYSYTLEQSTTLSDWTNVLTFWLAPTNTTLTQTLSVSLATNAPMQFFRLRSP